MNKGYFSLAAYTAGHFAVLVRSYAGFLFHMPWKQGFLLVMAAAAAAAVAGIVISLKRKGKK